MERMEQEVLRDRDMPARFREGGWSLAVFLRWRVCEKKQWKVGAGGKAGLEYYQEEDYLAV